MDRGDGFWFGLIAIAISAIVGIGGYLARPTFVPAAVAKELREELKNLREENRELREANRELERANTRLMRRIALNGNGGC